MFSISGLNFTLRLTEKFLDVLIGDFLRRAENQALETKIPLVGKVSIRLSDIGILNLRFLKDRTHFTLNFHIDILPESRILPQIKGRITMENSLKFLKDENLEVEYKVMQAEWLEGPTSASGKTLKIIQRISAALLKNTDKMEEIVENRIRMELSAGGLSARLQQILPTGFMVGDHNLHVSSFHLRYWKAHIHDQDLLVEGQMDGQIDKISSAVTEMSIENLQALQVTSILIDQELINLLLKASLSQINAEMPSLTLDDLSMLLEQDKLTLWLLPRQLNKPIRLVLRLKYHEQRGLLELIECSVKSGEQSGLLVKALLKLFSGKIEDMIENYFPIDLETFVTALLKDLGRRNTPVMITPQALKFQEIRFDHHKLVVLSNFDLMIKPETDLLQ